MGKMVKDDNVVVLSAGGTGGHMTPALALGHDLMSRGYRVVLFTDTRGMKFKSMFGGVEIREIRSGVLGAGAGAKIAGVFNMGVGIMQAFSALRALRPSLVVGFGGYPAVPGVFAAQKLGIPTIIHEQNAIIGKANLFLASKAERIALSLPNTNGLDELDRLRSVITGNPVRPDIAALYNEPYPVLKNNGAFRIFVVGGSLGAKVFSEIVPAALAGLPADHKQRLHIVQQCREDDVKAVRAAYEEAGIEAELATFFDDVADQFNKAHLIIARSGASTVAEVTTAGRPAIFVPYPHHKDQQQKMNADAVADVGGAWMMTESGFTKEALLARIETFLQNPETLFKAAEAARSCGKPDAARKLGNLVTAIASGWD